VPGARRQDGRGRPGRALNRDFAVRLVAMAAAAALLYGLSRLLLRAPCWSLVFLVAAIAWPMWVGQREYALFRHRLTLAATTLETSRVRRWFWRGRFTSFVQMLAAFFWAALLLAFVPLLDRWHLALLAADVLALALAAGYARALLARDVRDEHLGLLSRRWVLLAANLAFLAASFFAIDYFVVGAPDTRALAWNVVADRAFLEFARDAACPLAGMAVGFLNAVDQLNWHAAQVLIPTLPVPGLKGLAWAVFLLQAGLVSFAFTRLLLGALALAARLEPRPPGTSDSLFPWSLPLLAAVFLLGAYALRGFDPAAARPLAQAVVERINPCRVERSSLAALRGDAGARIERARAMERERAATEIDRTLDALFAEAETGVDVYLDWYFSVLGEYERIAAHLGSRSVDRVGALLNAELEKALLGGPRIGERLSEANQRIVARTTAGFSAVALQLGSELQRQAGAKPCWTEALHLPAIPAIERDVRAATTSIASGLVVGLVTSRVLAGRLSQTVVSRLASRRAYGSAATIAGRAVGKRAGSVVVAGGTASAACAPGGPLALLCGLVAGVVTWVTVDKALVLIDELRFRDEMRAEILDSLREQKAELAGEMRLAHEALIERMAAQVHASVDRVFVPARDG
jgi:hypothetical protein